MRMLVTGGAGFIGSHFIDSVARTDTELFCVDALTYAGCIRNIRAHIEDGRVGFFCADIRDRTAMERIFRDIRPDTVVNFASESHVDRSLCEPLLFTDTNTLGTAVLLEMARKYGATRFHQVSTDEVYGDLPLSGGEPFGEEAALKPSSPYSASKAAADLLALSYRRSFGLSVTVSRSSNNYGARQFPEKLIPKTLLTAMKGDAVAIYGKGLNLRDWIYVGDHVEAIRLILEKGQTGGIYNIGTGDERSSLEMATHVLSLAGLEGARIEFTEDRPGHDLRYSMRLDKIESLGFRPRVSLDEGLRATVDWYKNNSDFLGSILSLDYQRENDLFR